MRGADTFTESLFTLCKLDDFVPTAHPLRAIRTMANAALAKMGGLLAIWAPIGGAGSDCAKCGLRRLTAKT